MAVIKTLSNHFRYQLAVANINFSSDAFKIILMDALFQFDRDSHATLADVAASQLPTGNGYSQNTKALSGVSIIEDDTNDRAVVTWDNAIWTASGGAIGPTGAAIVYDDTTADDTIVGCIENDVDVQANDQDDIQVTGLGFNI